MNDTYHLGLLYLIHLLVSADGNVHPNEIDAFQRIRRTEEIPDETFRRFERAVRDCTEREIYEDSIDLINQCSEQERLRAFVTLYKLSEIDGRVHTKEIRLLLYSIEMAGIEFNDVVNAANEAAPL